MPRSMMLSSLKISIVLKKYIGLILTLFFTLNSANAAVVMIGTRIIFPAQKLEHSLQFQNKGQAPYLVQLWLEPENTDQAQKALPFITNPTFFKINAEQGQIVRLIFIGEESQYPQDRESLFYLNFSEIPATKNTVADNNKLTVIFKNKVKVFYRPKSLQNQKMDIKKDLSYTIFTQNNKQFIKLINQGPFYITLAKLNIQEHQHQILTIQNDMISPKSELIFPVEKPIVNPEQSRAEIEYINDYGATVPSEITRQRNDIRHEK